MPDRWLYYTLASLLFLKGGSQVDIARNIWVRWAAEPVEQCELGHAMLGEKDIFMFMRIPGRAYDLRVRVRPDGYTTTEY